MDTVLFTIRYGFVARNMLRTGVLRGLRAAGLRVVVATPAYGEPYLQEEAAARGFELRPYPRIKSSRAETAFSAAANSLLFDHPGTTFTMGVKWRRLRAEGRWGAFAGKALAAPLKLQRSAGLRRAAERVDARFHHTEAAGLFDEVDPSLVVATDLFGSEVHFLREARRRGIPSACVVKSWDNLTSKSRIRVEPDFYSVWNHLQLDEIVRLHFISPSRVFVSGAPNFDAFAPDRFRAPQREEFCRRLGIDPHRKLVVYSPGAKLTYSDDANIRLLHRTLQASEHRWPFHLYIRKYPKSPQTFDHLALPNLSVGEAGIPTASWADHVDQSEEQLQFLGELMHHADLLVHIGSTLAVDAACFDTPTIGYGLDAGVKGSRWHYAPFVFDLTHNRYLTDLGGQRVVRSQTELADAIEKYFADPSRDSEGRKRVVQAVCGAFDGRSGDRIASFLLGVLRRDVEGAMRRSLPAPAMTRRLLPA